MCVYVACVWVAAVTDAFVFGTHGVTGHSWSATHELAPTNLLSYSLILRSTLHADAGAWGIELRVGGARRRMMLN